MDNLTPAMQAAMWTIQQRPELTAYTVQLPPHLATTRPSATTYAALMRRGLIGPYKILTGSFRAMGHEFTDQGASWISDQIASAHASAHDEAAERQTWDLMARHDRCPRGCRADYLASPALAIECDHVAALWINVELDSNLTDRVRQAAHWVMSHLMCCGSESGGSIDRARAIEHDRLSALTADQLRTWYLHHGLTPDTIGQLTATDFPILHHMLRTVDEDQAYYLMRTLLVDHRNT